MAEPTPRLLAVRVLLSLFRDGVTLTAATEQAAKECADRRDAALMKELCYGVARWYPRLLRLLARLLERPLKPVDLDVELLLLSGLYQLSYTRIPEHAAVQATVETCRPLRKPWATRLVNGVLRRFLRERARLEAALDGDAVARYAHPAWFIETAQQDWPDAWAGVLEAGNQRPPLTLRANRRRIARDELLHRFGEAGHGAEPCHHSPDGLVLTRPVDVTTLPGFADGLFSVQDEAAQLAAFLLDAQAGMRVLDACAAPGGKTCHLLEQQAELAALVAVEKEAVRAQRIHENFRRLGLAADVRVADAATPAVWWDGVPFDRILLDAPCSASGVVRRHPDIKLLRTPAEVSLAAGLQARLLTALWPLLAPGGKLLYVTCSVFRRENAMPIEAFLSSDATVLPVPIEASWGRVSGAGRQILTGEHGMDGFFYACLQKRA